MYALFLSIGVALFIGLIPLLYYFVFERKRDKFKFKRDARCLLALGVSLLAFSDIFLGFYYGEGEMLKTDLESNYEALDGGESYMVEKIYKSFSDENT